MTAAVADHITGLAARITCLYCGRPLEAVDHNHDDRQLVCELQCGCGRRFTLHVRLIPWPTKAYVRPGDGTKWCPACHQPRSRGEFNRSASRPDGLAGECRRHTADRVHQWRARHREVAS
jgi:hypothetical protein